MAAPETLKYRAFLSYSHRDSAAAKRLHTRLEGFRIDKDLIDRATSMGPVPKQLRPIFRDRHDFDAGGTLGEQTIAAIDAAGAMILLASPASASSRPVNEEVRPIYGCLARTGFPTIKAIISTPAIRGRLARWTPETLMPEKRTRSADQRQQYQPKDE